MELIARFSYVLFALVLLAGMGVAVYRLPDVPLLLLGLLALLALLVGLWVLARRGTTPPNPEKRLKKSLGAGRPVVVHFYSDFALASMLGRPAMAALERRYKGRVEFLHMSLLDPHVRALARRLQAGVGTTLVYDAWGQQVQRRRPTLADLHRLVEQAGRSR